MQAEIITIGDEILIGQIIDTNSAYISKALNSIGVRVNQITSIQDDRQQILQTFAEAADRVALVIVTGGLGPTKDDITKSCFLTFFEDTLVLHEPTREHVKMLFATYIQKSPTDQNLQQALVPSQAEVLHNAHGTAPGLWMVKNNTVFVSLPGVPFEMKHLFQNEVLPRVMTHFKRPFIYHQTLLTYGLGESSISDRIEAWESALPVGVKLAYLPSFGKVRLRLSASHSDESFVTATIDTLMGQLKEQLSDIAIGLEGQTTMVEQIADLLNGKGHTLSLAESCTGGALAREITAHSGVSSFYRGGLIPYATDLKIKILGIDPALIAAHSTVSLEVAEAMAQSTKKLFGSDYALATTGIAGPTKGDGEGEVGTVCIAIAGPSSVCAEQFIFGKARERIIQKSVDKAFEMLYKEISKI
ncbi:MAG: CinA family nicotinamide mononucleotide deamidase-related protein [Flavobacteriaceae bacterium]|nr:CinA family nicotinamide mononucleotide deamidase-related protein [Flavobacteriaceae bacterium]MDG1962033.1 CinA family nicotinamide mononucleotide deamidase-related protein [Flavobacteriaceae bacterium]